MRTLFTGCCYWLILSGLGSCIQPYAPEALSGPTQFLVVDGCINPRGVTTIRLSRTRPLQDDSKPVESKASLAVEEEGGPRHPLLETAVPGTYTSAALQLPAGRRVRLIIKTAAQREYASDYSTVTITPEIDAVTWHIGPEGVQFNLSTHGAQAASRYYRWEYEETWKFVSAFESTVEFSNGRLIPRTTDIYRCWGSEPFTRIKIGNTARLTQNTVADYPLQLLPSNSVKLRFRYSILVKQYALTAAEYAYWEALGKNTENIGSLYDALPTQLAGNVHALADAAEPVLGFVGAQSVTQQRLYIDRTELPTDWRFETGYNDKCELSRIPVSLYQYGNYTPVELSLGSTTECVDCRKRGTNIEPTFWQD
ncbi:DUF4249 domain-containing protein [Hymenobacter metallicola]|uniref:DUF4249 domain-containing protein n=1 Tax=Hymenobacter metallicola TaxID=2563114 RepID=A0A4Z0PZK3_9BACT|nr:DUF4249 domain-containing protein [Hymenobacter metallicola]TGE22865.1 DUF4249 domain-containing protein [Hymenobacter metallicola]